MIVSFTPFFHVQHVTPSVNLVMEGPTETVLPATLALE